LRSGTRVMPVQSLILLVTAEALANAIYGSVKWR